MTPGGDDAGYDHRATARWAAEPSKQAAASGRGPFVRDRARVLHSAALRRLAAKTQVVAPDSGDFPRTRLTHSLECAQIGRELGGALGCDPDLVDAACLAHDLGHPPFGHNGEAALAVLAAGCGGFEGNAQSLRLLTRLEAKAPGAGLNLTRATLDATLKYPWLAPDPAAEAEPGKYGAYGDDAAVFAWVREGAPPGRPCFEAQVMDWADDVAYSVHDLEDGLHAGLIRLGQLRDPAERAPVIDLTMRDYCPPGSVTRAELDEVFAGLLALDFWPGRFDGSPAAAAAVKNLTSELIGRFCGAAEAATRPPGAPPVTRYAADLVVPRRPAAGVRAAQGGDRAVRHVPARRRRAAGPRARDHRRADRGRAGRGARHPGPGLRGGLPRGRLRYRPPPRGHRPGRLADRHLGPGLASATAAREPIA